MNQRLVEKMTDSIHEMNVVGRELSSKTFSGKPLDYNIPDIFQVPTNQDLILSCIESYFSQFDDFALLLSGGKDSRLLACILKKMHVKPMCYTYIGRHGNNKNEENEVLVAKKVAGKIAYGKVMKTGVNNTPIKGGFDKEVIETTNKQKRYRLDNYKWWKEIHG